MMALTMSESRGPVMTRTGPSGPRVAFVSALAAGASVVVNLALVHLATSFDPALQHYSHFRLLDYGTLTVIGVLCAGVAWYLAARNLATPRPTFFRVAVGSMLVLWLPDVWLYVKHEPTRAVTYLIVMHLAVALITYSSLVFGAPVKERATSGAPAPSPHVARDEDTASPRVRRVWWVAMLVAVILEFVTGLLGMLYVPFNRANGWLAHRGEVTYLVHALLGALLGLAAVALAFHVLRTPTHRIDRIAAVSGLCGVLIGAVGGVLCVSHSLRLLGMALMFVGVAVAFFGYLIAMIDNAQSVASTSPSANG
jgi:hypothetical protein